MGDEIAEAISRLILVSGGSAKAKQYLDTYINEEEPFNSASISTLSTDSAGSRAAAILPSSFLTSMENPWQEGGDSFARDPDHAKLSPRSNLTSTHKLRSVKQSRDGTRYANMTHSLTDGSPAWRGGHVHQSSAPSRTPVRPRPDHTRILDHRSPLYGIHHSPSPAPTVATLSQESDQPLSLSLRNLSLTSSREQSPVNHTRTAALAVGSPSPTRMPKTPGNGTSLHAYLAAIGLAESGLSKKDLKLKIQANPDYVGEKPYIRVQNPQYRINILVHVPPKSSNGKWYLVSRGTAVGIFNNWGQTAKATQGVPRSVYKSFGTRGEAIVEYQVALLRGEVLLMNEKLANDTGGADDESEDGYLAA